MNNDATPNAGQAHASLSTTGTASTLAELGYTFDAETDSLVVQAIGGDVRFTVNGTTPTTSLGLKLSDGDWIELGRNEAEAAKFITASGTPKLEIAAYIA
jgi:hypothetical protein